MGGATSKSNTNVKTKLVVEAVSKNIMKCSSNAGMKQRTIISGDYNVIDGFKQVFTVTLSGECKQDAQSEAELQQSVANAIKAAAEATGVTMTGVLGKSSSEVNVSIDNEVRQTITQENILDIVNKVNLEQELVVSGNRNIIKNFSQLLTADLVYRNSQKLVNQLKSVQTIENDATTQSTATQKSVIAGVIDSVGGVVDGIFDGMNTTVLIFIAALLIGMYLGMDIIKGLLGIEPSPPPGQQQPANYGQQQPANYGQQQPANYGQQQSRSSIIQQSTTLKQ
jgi:hypothetical protein